jgi:hypothetical protein
MTTRPKKPGPELAAALRRQHQAFRDKFGYDPRPDDPIFFDPTADGPRTHTEDQQVQFEEAMCAAMVRAKIDPAFIHVFRKTGRILTRENIPHLTPAELAEWNGAIQEYKETS